MNYIPRTLIYYDANLNQITIKDDELLNLDHSVVILAEPGMGKSRLLDYLATADNTVKFTASSFVRKPAKLLQDIKDKIVLIDALDEYQGRADSNSIDDILNKLFELNNPKFILSCRQVEWESSSIENIKDFYGSKPLVAHIQPFNRKDAITFLKRHDKFLGDASQMIERLDEVNLSDFYKNPLTLELLTHINTDTLPENKAEVLDLATQNLWQEVNDRAPNHLKETGSQSVLDCAGFVCATLLLAQKQVVFIGNTAKTPEHALNIHELKVRYDEELLLDTLKCRLFKATDEVETFKPMHRTIAEFLGAKWLAGLMIDPIIKTRVLAQFIQNGGVVSSLRGLFSWLPYFNPNLVLTVIETDPYALIAYADTSFFNDRHSRLMYDALKRLVVVDPYFRRGHWSWLKSKGLANRCLLEDYRQLLGDKNSDYNLRSSIIQILQDADFISDLKEELTAIMMDSGHHYSERHDACLLLLNKHIDIDWSTVLDTLTGSQKEDDLRLVCECIMLQDNYHLISDKQLVRLILHSQPLDKETLSYYRPLPNSGSYYYFDTLPSTRAINILNLLIDAIENLKISPYEINLDNSININDLIFLLLNKYLANNSNIDPLVIAKSLCLFYHNDSYLTAHEFKSYSKFFSAYFLDNSHLKYSIQKLLLNSDDFNIRFYKLKDSVLSALYPSSDDMPYLIDYVQNLDNSESNKNIWKDLLLLNRSPTGFPVETLRYIEDFISDKPDLLDFVSQNNQPRQKGLRELEYERESRKRLLEKKLNQQKNRIELRKNLNKLETGDFHTCFYPANILLKRYSDLPKELSPYSTLAFLLKEELAHSARIGFERSLFSTLPNPIDFVFNEHKAKQTVLFAGIYCRYLDNKNIDDLADNVILIAAIIIAMENYFSSDYDTHMEVFELVKEQVIKRGLKDKLVDILLIPQFENNWQYIHGMHWLTATGVTNTDLDKIVNILENQKLNFQNQRTLLETLINNQSLTKLKPLICRKVSNIEKLNESDNARDASLWLALYSYIDPTDFINKAKCFSYRHELFWQLRKLYQKSSRNIKVSCSDFLKEWIV